MFFGGTNFGFTAGANSEPTGRGFKPDITSYDYDAPMNEAGDPTDKYYKLREVIGKYLHLPDGRVPRPKPKAYYGKVNLSLCCSMLSETGRTKLSTGNFSAKKPLSFEALNQYSGMILYETVLPQLRVDTAELLVPKVHDRAYVYINGHFMGVLSRKSETYKISIKPGFGGVLQILVENQGRINFGITSDFKGILGDVFVDNKKLKNWNMTMFPLESYDAIIDFVKNEPHSLITNLMNNGPTFFSGQLFITNVTLFDTFLSTKGWGKGIVFVNGFNLGRYWPEFGPQITLYVPKEILKSGSNDVIVLEYEKMPDIAQMTFVNKPDFDEN